MTPWASPVLTFAVCLLLGGCPLAPTSEPGPLQAGSATVRMPAPLGIGTAGFNGLGVAYSPTPYASLFPGTTRIHGHPTLKALVLSRGTGHEVVILRTDQVAVLQGTRAALLEELKRRGGHDLEQALVLAATHTHAGPGRFADGALYALIADTFFPAFYERLVMAMADAVEAAFADLGPAELGHATTLVPTAHRDRRCEDMEMYTNDALELLVVRKQERVSALVAAYAVHSTVIGNEELTLSQDVAGAMEEQIAALFPHPVTVLALPSWAADMSPASPQAGSNEDDTKLSKQPRGYDRLERIGMVVAQATAEALPQIEVTSEPRIESHTAWYALGRGPLGYDPGEFPFPFGAVFCMLPGASCDENVHLDGLDRVCVPFPSSQPAPDRSLFTFGALGDLHFVTWGGECSTRLAEATLARLREHSDVDSVMFLGYANDYLGYQLREEDWWNGGYEASGGVWGPRQGDYMAERLITLFAAYKQGVLAGSPVQPPALASKPVADQVAWSVEPAKDLGAVAEQPSSMYLENAVVSAAVYGADPWFGAPKVFLQQDGPDGFVDLLQPSGLPYQSDGYGFYVDLRVAPAYANAPPGTPRHFRWEFHMPLARRSLTIGPTGAQRYRFRMEVPVGINESLEVTTEGFRVLSRDL